ncbi:DinB family protein [Pseudovibrio axinellae]|uniref:DinB family protein n=1 Tax=Pseudovibrio axinellae TaxID=989403 RepID=A0A165YDU7_9HYPH|nr:DinB family protein [Pseudovibrio axinellae]KZL18753.1 DinB family protein [Pseudovibrio axinellae]SEP94079.1 Uncharacterized damage-inducible protein DinB (forms a four-helix bundle) [Pseudovibrio axinellae]
MTVLHYFQSQAKNNAWANYRLLSSCQGLSQQELVAERAGFFPSILLTLNHLITVDWFYISALEGKPLGIRAFEPEYPFTEFAPLFEAQRLSDCKLVEFVEALKPAELSRTQTLREDKSLREQVDRILLHLFQHQIHHRGQLHAMLSGTSVKPPQLDEFFLGNEMEQNARREDFAELGFSEEGIWGGREEPRE